MWGGRGALDVKPHRSSLRDEEGGGGAWRTWRQSHPEGVRGGEGEEGGILRLIRGST